MRKLKSEGRRKPLVFWQVADSGNKEIRKGSLRKAGKILGLFCSLYSLLEGLEDFHQYIILALMAKAIIKCFILICEVSV